MNYENAYFKKNNFNLKFFRLSGFECLFFKNVYFLNKQK